MAGTEECTLGAGLGAVVRGALDAGPGQAGGGRSGQALVSLDQPSP